jgi:hypothetical protein
MYPLRTDPCHPGNPLFSLKAHRKPPFPPTGKEPKGCAWRENPVQSPERNDYTK